MSKIIFVNLQLETDHLSNPETYKDNAKMPPIAPIESTKFKTYSKVNKAKFVQEHPD